jgi:HAD superfamily hydrolase (TIGR01509 family)
MDLPGTALAIVRMHRMFKAVIFDMDGVIVDSEPRHARAFEEVFRQMGYAENHGMDFAAYYGRSDRTLWYDFVAKHHPPFSIEHLVAWKQSVFLDLIHQERPIYPEIPGLVEKLSGHYLLGLASGSVRAVIDEVLALENLACFFPIRVSTQEVAQGKPAPDVFLRTAELLRVAPTDCCVIEDTVAGVDAALAAGMRVIAITNTFERSKLGRAHWVVDRYADIEERLLQDTDADRTRDTA